PVEAAVGSAARLAAATGAVSALSGATDAISDGGRVLRLRRGHPTMARSVGVGCALSALCAAFLGTGASAWDAAVAACLTAGLAGESAAATARGPGGFPAAWLDAMALLGAEDLNAAAGEAIDGARA
ncbi:MAG: hydroxyethylthiazole kinase, partial [Pseudomonadota bacterium]